MVRSVCRTGRPPITSAGSVAGIISLTAGIMVVSRGTSASMAIYAI
jgi:hypothetical protein